MPDSVLSYEEAQQRCARWHAVTIEGRHHVLVVHPESPEWYRLVATFQTRQRAEDYADFENTFAADKVQDQSVGHDSFTPEDLPAPPGLPTIPVSAVRAELVRPATPAERARVGAELLSDAAAGAGATLRIEAGPAAALPEPAPEIAPSGHPGVPAGQDADSVDKPEASLQIAQVVALTGATEPPRDAGPKPSATVCACGKPKHHSAKVCRDCYQAEGDVARAAKPKREPGALSPNQERTLAVLQSLGPGEVTTMADLAKRAAVPYGSITQAIYDLEYKGRIGKGRPWLRAATGGRPISLAVGPVPVVEPMQAPGPKPAVADAEAEQIARFIAEHGVTRAVDWGVHKELVETCKSIAYDIARQKPGSRSRGAWLLNNAALDTAETYRRVNLELVRRGRAPIGVPKDGRAA